MHTLCLAAFLGQILNLVSFCDNRILKRKPFQTVVTLTGLFVVNSFMCNLPLQREFIKCEALQLNYW